MRRMFFMLVPLLTVVGLGLTAGPAGAQTIAHSSLGSRAAAAARAALKYVSVGHPAGQRAPGHVRHVRGLTKVDYYNWSGYADDNSTGKTYSTVTGSWTEPAITCSNEDQIAVFWVGIDGFSDGTVEQDGTLAQCFKGTAFYYTWWEMFPTNNIQLVGSTVVPGDKIAGSVVKSGTSYTLKLTDSTHTADSFTEKETCAAASCVDSSAEWIAESPSGPRGYYPLPDFKTWTLSAATVKSGSTTGKISTFPDDEITMIDSTGTYPLASPGSLNSAGNSFKVTWKNSY
jgi:Peptidase A4 family